MKNLRKITGILILALCVSSTHAVLINISNVNGSLTNGVGAGDIPGGADPATLHAYLTNSIIPGYNLIAHPSPSLAPPDIATLVNYSSVANGAAGSTSLTGFKYASVHYAGGPGGGMHVFYDLNGMTGNYTFPANGSDIGDGTGNGVTYGNGKYIGTSSISNVRLWGNATDVSDGASTFFLLSFGLILLGFLKRKKSA